MPAIPAHIEQIEIPHAVLNFLQSKPSAQDNDVVIRIAQVIEEVTKLYSQKGMTQLDVVEISELAAYQRALLERQKNHDEARALASQGSIEAMEANPNQAFQLKCSAAALSWYYDPLAALGYVTDALKITFAIAPEGRDARKIQEAITWYNTLVWAVMPATAADNAEIFRLNDLAKMSLDYVDRRVKKEQEVVGAQPFTPIQILKLHCAKKNAV